MISFFLGSFSDFPIIKNGVRILKDSGVPFKGHVCSAHRSPKLLVQKIEELDKSGCKVYIAAAGGAAHLAGVIASHTIRPVIGVPISGKLNGLDSLLSTSQMPKGVAVATVGVDNFENAVYLAMQMLSLSCEKAERWLKQHRENMVKGVIESDDKLREEIECM
jgi:5-(carboxyamino)imidazole ribonucleotide mutase